ncbi:trypsin-like serine peptidase [Microtetraspora glauca]|uniref:Trypsin-like serine protease n=1 Tax=Microtetraspora glauca TaxID=1996 RepID=A0ABV3GID9_MICGL
MKRTLAFGGAVAAAGLLAAGLTVPASAAPKDQAPSVILANTNLAARQIAAFWFGQRAANLIAATPYNVETKVVAKHVSTGGPAADSKPGVVPAIGDEKKTTAKSKNVNLPRTTGKVFFIGADHKPHWCSATSVQANYRNLVATAGHCVYDTESNKATLDKWVFIPGYYEGKTPWGIYVGKQAFTHYDYDVYEDGDRNFAFVTVYDGVLPTNVTKGGTYKKVWETRAEAMADASRLDDDPAYSNVQTEKIYTRDLAHSTQVEENWVHDHTRDEIKRLTGFSDLELGDKPASAFPVDVAAHPLVDAKFFEDVKATPGPDGGEGTNGGRDNWAWTQNEQNLVSKRGDTYTWRSFHTEYDLDFKVTATTKRGLTIELKSVGRLGDNVGGQGLAYNQKLGNPVFVFGYPSGAHLDGNHAYTGKTLKWSYGKTFAVQAPAIKGEELQGMKSSFTGEGSIGSSWLLKYNNSRRLGYLNGVTIGVADTDANNRFDTSVSPYFDGETYGVYKAAANVWSGKIV